MNQQKCIAGCKHFTGGEVKHHKDCPHYPESFSKMYDDLKLEVKKLNAQLVSKSEGLQCRELLIKFLKEVDYQELDKCSYIPNILDVVDNWLKFN